MGKADINQALRTNHGRKLDELRPCYTDRFDVYIKLDLMLRRRDLLLLAALMIGVGAISAYYLTARTISQDEELAACAHQCKDVGKSPSLAPLSTTQTSRFGGFSGPSKCVCIP